VVNRESIPAKRSSPDLLRFLVPTIVFLIYLYTLYPGLGLIDSGELTAVLYTLGIAHPTGYPLYTILGRIFALLPIGSIPFRTNLLSAAAAALASLFLFLFFKELMKDRLLALVPVSFLAFSTTIWSIANLTEVYALTYLLLAIDLYLFQKGHDTILWYLLGLTLTNHMIGLSVVLPIAIFLLIKRRVRPLHPLLFLLGLSLYFYLPIRAQSAPILNWGDPSTLERLIWHITGKQYRVWMFSLPLSEVVGNLGTALVRFAHELLFILIPLLLLGLIRLHRDGYLYLAILALNIGYSINYSIPDVESYFIPSLLMVAILLARGLAVLRLRYLPMLALLPLIHLPQSNGRDYRFADDLAQNIIKHLRSKSLLICNVWDCYSPLLYYDVVENRAGGHWLIDKELLRRSWYLDYLRRRYPELCEGLKDQLSAYRKELFRFEHDLPYDRALIQERFEALIRGMVELGRKDRRVYILSPIPDLDLNRALSGLPLKPEGLLMRVGTEADTFDFDRLTIRLPDRIDDRHRFLISSIYLKSAYLNYQYYRSRSALEFFQKLTSRLR